MVWLAISLISLATSPIWVTACDSREMVSRQFSAVPAAVAVAEAKASARDWLAVFGAILGVLAGEIFAFHHAVGLVLVIGGIWLAERRAEKSH